MAAVAARVNTVRREAPAPRRNRATRARTRRRVRTRLSLVTMIVLFMIGLVLPFAYTGVYANLKKTSYTKTDLDAMCWREKVENQRLRVALDRRSSPEYVTAAALKLGMVGANRYETLDESRTIASADKR